MRTIYKLPIRWLLLAVAMAWGGAAWAQAGNLAKIDPELQELMHQSRDANERFRVIVEMAEQYDNPNLERGTALMTRAQRRDYVVNELKRFSEHSQAEVVSFLTAQGTRGQVNVLHHFWIFNGLCCEATAECIGELSTRRDVRYVSLDKEIELDEPERTEGTRENLSTNDVEWHVSKVRANMVWNDLGYTGAGIVVAILDTGVNYNHPDLSANMWDGGDLYPNHGWDFYDDDNDPMDINENPNAIDPNIAHGSLVAGILAGKRGTGVAPNAKIMALRINSDDDILSAIEFALEHGADVLNLSRGWPGVGGMANYRDSFVNVMNAGVVATVAAGNYGNQQDVYAVPNNVTAPGNCPPPWHHPDQGNDGGVSAVICVGNTTENDTRYITSSIGPATWTAGSSIGNYFDYPYEPGNNTKHGLIRPDISAPGACMSEPLLNGIIALWDDELGPYIAGPGTSDAAPCVAGVIALMLEANPNLTPAQIDEILETTAEPCENQTHKNNEYGAGRVDAFRAVRAARNLLPYTITAEPMPSIGGTIEGSGSFFFGEQCTLTATPNLGYAFAGWYNGAILVSMSPSYTFTVNGDKTLTAIFAPRDYTITLNASPISGGTISGGGTYPAGSMVTLTATAASGYYFNGWVENGMLLTNATNYMFTATADRNLTASFVSTQSGIGSVVTNADGSRGVLYHIDPSGVGWMVAMEDASEGCPWGPETNINALPDYPCNDMMALGDLSGLMNTGVLRSTLGTENDYAASQVDFDNGWYLPSAGQLRKLYAALPFVDSVLYYHGGTTLSEGSYWSSTEYSNSNAIAPMFAMSNYNKDSNCKVRAIRNYFSPQDNMIFAMPDSPNCGEVTNYHNGVYSYGENAAVIATPKPGYQFDHWSEEGLPVSYDRIYTFTFTHSRRLVAHFVVEGGDIGTIVHNLDGSDGVVFYMNPDGTEGLMVALEDASEGCPWGADGNIAPLIEYPHNDMLALNDMSGSHNTGVLRNIQGVDSTYAAAMVDYANGWYLPSAGELRKLYAVLPMIEISLIRAGGSTLTEDSYWSSTESSSSDAVTPSFYMGNTNKTSTCRVRAIRKFLTSSAHTLVATANDEALGTVSGSGEYEYNETVTLSAEPNEGYVFQSWTEDGIAVSQDATWQFPFTRNRVLVANFIVAGTVGEIVHNVDGSVGVVFYQNNEGTEGWMVALEDASEGCQWGPQTNINAMPDMPCNDVNVMEDVSGYRNTDIIRKVLGTNNDYAASVVDFDNGWYLPAAGQLRKLYAALPMIEESILNAGGTLLTEDAYWSSSEYNTSDAFSPMFAMSNASKTSSRRVRAIRNFDCSNMNMVRVIPNNVAFGSVAGGGNFEFGATVSVMASPNTSFVFDHWEEDDCVVSYDQLYSFTFTRTRTLTAVFVRENSIGSIVHNADGSTGVIFYTYPSGIGGLMVALEDDSEGCPWGLDEDVTILDNQSPSAVMDLLEDMSGKSNTNRIRQWYSDNAEYAACMTDYANGWYLPSAGQLRKLYAVLPIIEGAIVNAGGTTMTEDTYWSSTEQSASNAWTPSFAMSSSDKTGNCRVRAIRSLTDTETITTNVNIEGGGTVKGAGWYDHGQTCTLKAQTNESYAFLNWTCDGAVASTEMEYSFTVLGNQTYTANFVANSCNITTAIEPANSGTVTGAGIYTIGSDCTLTATPHIGYSFVNWKKNGSVVSTNSSYSFTVTESAQYTANFVITSYSITASANPTEGGTVSGAHAYTYGSTATLTATAAEGYTFINWTENGAVVSTSPTLQFEVYGNRTLVANFSANNYTVTAIALPSDGGTIEGDGDYAYGTTATLTAHPNPQFDFFCWFEDDDVLSFDPSVSFEVTEDVVIYAVFVENEDIIQTVNLSQGWNWFSTYLDITLDDLKAALVSALPGTNISINSQSVGSTTYANNRWRGTLTALDLSQMYMISVTADCEMTLVGVPIDPSVHPVTIHPDFNWMAFPLSQGMTLTNVFEGFAVNGDMVISQAEGSSTYTNRWRGTLSTLEPGRGYMYKSTVTVGDRVFTFPISTK